MLRLSKKQFFELCMVILLMPVDFIYADVDWEGITNSFFKYALNPSPSTKNIERLKSNKRNFINVSEINIVYSVDDVDTCKKINKIKFSDFEANSIFRSNINTCEINLKFLMLETKKISGDTLLISKMEQDCDLDNIIATAYKCKISSQIP